MKRIIFLFIAVFFAGSLRGQTENKLSVAAGGDIGWRGYKFANPIYVHSGFLNFYYTNIRGNRWGTGIMFSALRNYFFKNQNAFQLDRIQYFTVPVFFEKALIKKQNIEVYLFIGLTYHRLLLLESKIHTSSGVYTNPDLNDPFGLHLVEGKGGSSLEVGLNIRQMLGRFWSVNLAPYIQLRWIRIYRQGYGPLGIYPARPPYLTEDKGQVGLRVSLERSFGARINNSE